MMLSNRLRLSVIGIVALFLFVLAAVVVVTVSTNDYSEIEQKYNRATTDLRRIMNRPSTGPSDVDQFSPQGEPYWVDQFSPQGEPYWIVKTDDTMYGISRGPNSIFDLQMEDIPNGFKRYQYDPSNGAASSGDIVVEVRIAGER